MYYVEGVQMVFVSLVWMIQHLPPQIHLRTLLTAWPALHLYAQLCIHVCADLGRPSYPSGLPDTYEKELKKGGGGGIVNCWNKKASVYYSM